MSDFDYTKALGLGTSTIDRSVMGMPFIGIIQKGSPEFDETHRKYSERKIDGCRPGNVLFEPERAILPQPLEVIPLATTTLYTEWKPNQGGFVGNRDLTIVSHPDYRKGAPNTPTQYREYLGQNELVYTIYFFVLFKHGEKWKRGIIAFTSTQLKFGRAWTKMIIQTKIPGLEGEAPIFACSYRLSTIADSNEKGGFYSWKIEKHKLLDPAADQQLLENAFAETQKAQAQLPKPADAPALPEPVSVAPADDGEGHY